MYSDDRRNWIRKLEWSEDFRKESCAYCYFNCSEDICVERDYFCDNFLPNVH